jgi:hypothetical protein
MSQNFLPSTKGDIREIIGLIWGIDTRRCPMALRMRALSDAEVETMRQLAHSRTAPARAGAHGRADPPRPPSADPCPGAAADPHDGAEPAHELPSSGVGGVAGDAAARTSPARYHGAGQRRDRHQLDRPPRAGPTVCQLAPRSAAAHLHEVPELPMTRTRIDALLLRVGVRWRPPETWVGARGDPAFAERRGASRRSLPRRRRAV